MVFDSGPVHRPFVEGPFRLSMGLLPLDLAEWVEIDGTHDSQMAEKRRLMATRRDEVFGALPEALPGAEELLRLLLANVLRHHGDRFEAEGDGVRVRATGEVVAPGESPWHPLERAGRLVQEDWCLLAPDAADGTKAGEIVGHRLVAASLCFPSRWRLHDKLGRAMGAIHGPVPAYDAKLWRPVDRFLSLLKAEKPVRRANWGLHDDPALFQPAAGHGPGEGAGIGVADAGARLWLRVERQTLVRLPETGLVAFGIRTHVHRLDAAIRGAEDAAAMALAIRTMPPETLAYKGMAAFADAVLGWLDACAGVA